ncbi:MAG: phospho-sugar mutase [Bacteroidota bacterium]|nr:phospho-sugar mutase [Bacteroidota bacterium]
MAVEKYILDNAKHWLEGNFDEETKKQVQNIIDNDEEELTNAFYRDLEFGTGGLRGIMGVGSNRMNKYTVGMATQGLANYLIATYPNEEISLAIAYDNRIKNTYFAQITSDVLSANGIKVFLFDALRATPELSFAIRYLGCKSGIMITASHNPKEYNGYKVYWNDGGQIVNPHDINIIEEVKKTTVNDVNFNSKKELISLIGKEIDDAYLEKLKSLSLSPDIIEKQKDLKIVYTPIHGTGVKTVPDALKKFGFTSIYNIPEQDINDGNFPTVISPNPEEPEALTMAIKKATEVNASLVMATDPDGDRVGIAVKNNNNEFELLNGNQTASILIYYLLTKWKENNKIQGKEYIGKTIVTTELLTKMAESFNVPLYDTLTGFKFIAELIRKHEGIKTFIGGGEESYGYLIGDFVRDKDAVISCCMIAEAAAWAAENGKTMYQLLPEIYTQFGFYREHLISIKRDGKKGAKEIQEMMKNYRTNPPVTINKSKIICIKDYLSQENIDLVNNTTEKMEFPKSNVLQLFTQDGTKITMRPSGTEPKIKFYFSVNDTLENTSNFEKKKRELDNRINEIINDLNL